MSGIRYTATEKAQLVAAYRAGGLQTAYRVFPHRCDVGIRDLLKRMGVHIPKGSKKPWTMLEERTVEQMWHAGMLVKEIANATGHPYGSVLVHIQHHRKRLGLKPRTKAPKMTPGQLALTGRECEMLLDRIVAATGKPRGACKKAAITYLMMESKRVKAAKLDLRGVA